MTVSATLTQTLQSSTYFKLKVTAAATVAQQTDSAMVAVRPAVADVLSVTASPSAINAGDPVSVTAQVFNTANVARNVQAQIEILDSTGNAVGTPTDVPVNLVPGNGDLTLNLGQIATTGLANGLYSVSVSLVTANGSPLPGQSSKADFEIGQPVTASVAASANFVPPGTSTVTTTITASATSGFSAQSLGDIQVVYDSTNSFQFNGQPLGNLDAPAFVIQNTSARPITNGVLSVGPGGVSASDPSTWARSPPGSYAIIVPGLSDDGRRTPRAASSPTRAPRSTRATPARTATTSQFEFTGVAGRNDDRLGHLHAGGDVRPVRG